MKLGDLIIDVVKQLGVEHIFGVPGDYNLRFLDFIEESKELEWIGNCNELNASYAADGYAREKGIGVLVTTHGVGELSAANGIAGSFAHNVSVLHIVGYPSSSVIENDVPVHHTLGNYKKNNFLESFNPISGATAILTELNYIEEINRVISNMLTTKKPAYLGIPANLLDMEVSESVEDILFRFKSSDSYMVEEVGNIIAERFETSQKPMFLLGVNIARFGWRKEVTKLLRKTQSKFTTTLMGKSIIRDVDIAKPNYIGIYAADYSTGGIVELMQNSDCIISIGTVQTDLNSGGFSEDGIDYANVITIRPQSVKIGKKVYSGISIEMLLEYLIKNFKEKKNSYGDVKLPKSKLVKSKDEKLNQKEFWPYIAKNIIQEGDIVVAEAGSSLFGLLPQDLPAGIDFVSQILWASIGYTLPAAIGSAIAAPNRRVLLFIGDGSFQLTAQELSLIAKYDLNVQVFLINNDGYTIERAIHGPKQPYNDVYMWKYLDLAKSLGVEETMSVTTFKELFQMSDKMKKDGAKMIELFFEKLDYPPLMKQISDKLAAANK
ncbi:MAG TPA: alpha-keto acid decarboxylase family protein [Sulfurospirillum arcachonense]|nr:alpha-keto acid decarboxylase family protein [Sulfurospirillum arcachonense]